jgi:hypothetical protein
MEGKKGKGEHQVTPENEDKTFKEADNVENQATPENKDHTIQEVIDGLKQGKKFKRNSTNATEYVTPCGEGMFTHDVVGNDPDQGAWGGSTQLTISILDSGRWNEDDWKLVE